MRTRAFGLVAALCCTCAVSVRTIGQQNQPNLIFILTDDQGAEAVQGPYWGNQMGCVTPTLDRLAMQGVSFTQCRVNPNCSPTRACMMTGRYAFDTGVHGVLGRFVEPLSDPCPYTPLYYPYDRETNRMAMQTQERTLGEMLQDMGYYTILVDKWHLGYNEGGEDLGLLPRQQGFDEDFDWLQNICDDEPDQVGDEHIVRAYEFAVEAVTHRGDKPYALFFHTVTPHSRSMDQTGLHWWEVDPALTPLTAYLSADPTNTNRYIQNVEMLDTIIRRMLVDLNVIDDIPNQWPYNPASDAVVFFTSDNGSGHLITTYRDGDWEGGKNTLYEGGVKVPLFVFGANVPSNLNRPIEDTRQVSDVDYFDTIADIIGAPEQVRDNSGGQFPRQSMSFADSIGYAQPDSLPRRQFTLCSLGSVGGNLNQVWRVALVWDHYKLICNGDSHNAQGQGLDDMSDDEFYDLSVATQGRPENLLEGAMTSDEVDAYWYMRDQIVDQWPGAVCDAFEPAQLNEYVVEHYSSDNRFVYMMHIVQGQRCNDACDEFYDLLSDPDRTDNLVGQQMTGDQSNAYNSLLEEAEESFLSGAASPDVRIIDVPLTATRDVSSANGVLTGPLTVGFKGVGNNQEIEYRAGLKFSLSGASLPEGFTIDDVVDAQVIVAFGNDSTDWHDATYFAQDTDTGVISLYRFLSPWSNNLNFWNTNVYGTDVLGKIDLPPHIIPDPDANIRGTPLPTGNPVSFGHSQNLLNVVRDWYNNPRSNYGIALIGERLNGMTGNQQVNFLRQAKLRLTLDRRNQNP